MSDSICLDTENRTSSSTLSVPTFKINRLAFLKGQKVRINVVIPPLYNIDSTNNSIILNNTTYSITEGFYDGIDSVISAFNTTINSTGISIDIDSITGLITISHSTSNFTMSQNLLFGFTSSQSGSSSYTAIQGNSLNKNTICICSNLSGLFNQMNINKQQEVFLPRNYIFSFMNNAVNSYNYVSFELKVDNNVMYDELTFYFGNTGNPPTISANVRFNWSIILEVYSA